MPQNAVIVLTGASSGIGRALALKLAGPGTSLVLAARSEASLADVVDSCQQAGAQALAVATDVTERSACQRLIEVCLERFGRLDMLINNAGLSMTCAFSEIEDLGLFEKLMRVNYLGPVYLTHYALDSLKATRGLIVAVSSLQGKTGFPLSTGYCASKHAVQGFYDALRIELCGTGVDVLVVSPGAVDTRIHTLRAGADGEVREREGGVQKSALMPVEECARQIHGAIMRRQRELVMTASGRWLVRLKPFFPAWIDRRVARAVDDFYVKAD